MSAKEQGLFLKSIFVEYLQLIKEVEAELSHEKTYLEHEDADNLLKISDNKQHLLKQIQLLDNQLVELLEQQPYYTTEEKIQSLLSQCEPEQQHELKSYWTVLRTTLERCQDMNTINAGIVTPRLKSIRRTLNLLIYGDVDPVIQYDEKGEVLSAPAPHNKEKV